MGVITLIKTLPKAIVKGGGKLAFVLKKAKPEILVVGGVAVATGAFVWAIANARKLDTTLEETKAKVEEIEAELKDIPEDNKPSIRECEKRLNKAKADSIWRVFCLVGLPAITFAGGVAMVCGGHLILLRRFGALSSSFALLQSKYERYRQMNIAEHGEECDQRYLFGIPKEGTGIEGTVTDENGKAEKVKGYVPIQDDLHKGGGLYTFIFSEEFSDVWNRDPIMNISFLKSQESYWNAMLGTGKVITLKDVLDGIGIETDPNNPAYDYTMIAGWRPNGDGDRRVDFGINNPVNKATLDLRENYLVLNFNCDGNLYHSARYDRNGRKIA